MKERTARAYCAHLGVDPNVRVWGYVGERACGRLWLPRWAWYMRR